MRASTTITNGGATMLKVGEKAPDFELQAYHQETFKQIKLADYAGKWVILYFYPADFTFV